MKNLKANLPKGEQKVMEEFAKRKNILVITDASKDSAVVQKAQSFTFHLKYIKKITQKDK